MSSLLKLPFKALSMKIVVYYGTNIEIRLGDEVEIKRFLRKSIMGKVHYVYDPKKPSIPKGDNEVGFGIQSEDGKSFWWCPLNDSAVQFLRRGHLKDSPEI
jgi:hypothetical protein